MDSLLELFVNVDDFCQVFLPQFEQQMLASGAIKRLDRDPYPLVK